MKTKDLIKRLKKLNPEMEVFVPMPEKDSPVYKKSKSVKVEVLSDLYDEDAETVVIIIR